MSTPEHPLTVNGPLDLGCELQQKTIVGLSCLCLDAERRAILVLCKAKTGR